MQRYFILTKDWKESHTNNILFIILFIIQGIGHQSFILLKNCCVDIARCLLGIISDGFTLIDLILLCTGHVMKFLQFTFKWLQCSILSTTAGMYYQFCWLLFTVGCWVKLNNGVTILLMSRKCCILLGNC